MKHLVSISFMVVLLAPAGMAHAASYTLQDLVIAAEYAPMGDRFLGSVLDNGFEPGRDAIANTASLVAATSSLGNQETLVLLDSGTDNVFAAGRPGNKPNKPNGPNGPNRPPAPVPEPATILLLGSGLLAAGVVRHFRARHKNEMSNDMEG